MIIYIVSNNKENYIGNVLVNDNIDKIYNLFEVKENYDIDKLDELSKNARKEWKKREKILSCFIEHDEIEKINIKLDMLCIQIKNENWTDSKSTVSEIIRLIKYLDGKYELSIQNIF